MAWFRVHLTEEQQRIVHEGLPVVTGQNRSLVAEDSKNSRENKPFRPCTGEPDEGWPHGPV